MEEEGLTAVLTARLTKILSFCGFLFDGPVVIRVPTERDIGVTVVAVPSKLVADLLRSVVPGLFCLGPRFDFLNFTLQW